MAQRGSDGLAGGVNLHAYVRSNPITLVDPDGLNPLVGVWPGVEIGGIIGGPGGAIIGGVIGGAIGLVIGTELADWLNNKFSQKGKQNVRDTGLEHLSNEEVSRRARDRSLGGEEKRKYQREEKREATEIDRNARSRASERRPRIGAMCGHSLNEGAF